MAESGGQERTEQPTPKRLREAREKGQVPRSRELSTMMVLLAASGALMIMGGKMLGGLSGLVANGLTLERDVIFDSGVVVSQFGQTVHGAMTILVPFFIVVTIAALVAPLALGGWSFSVQALSFKPEKLDPIKGLGKLFSWRGLMELVKALAKFLVVATVAVLVLWFFSAELMGLSDEPLRQAMAHGAKLLGITFVILSAALIFIAAVDVPFQLWNHSRQLKMTRQEVKDEMKETEGHPEVKSRIRSLQRELAQRRMMEEVPQADVVVTNPTHFAVALRYDQNRMAAPKLVAKGADLVAMNIRRIAEANGVTLFEAPPLARALYHSAELGQEIPAGLYLAVAQVLAYVFQIRTVNQRGGARPKPPEDLSVPDEYLKGGAAPA